MTFTQDYAGIRCLVIGADGFIGRSVTRALHDAGADVHAGVLDPLAAGEVFVSLGIAPTIHGADLSAPGSARDLVEGVAPATVFNLAGYGVRPSESDEVLANRLNTDLPAELAAAVASRRTRAGVPALVHVGSAAEYGHASGHLLEDGDALPFSLYGRTKLAGTLAALEAAPDHAVVARPFTVFGPGEPPHRLLPSLIRAARSGDPVPLSDGRQRRDFTYVADVAEGLLRLGASPGSSGHAVNLCTGTLLAVKDFVVAAAGILGIADDALRFGELGGGLHDMAHDAVCIDRLESLTAWRPRIDVAEGVRRTRDLLSGD